MVRDLSNSGPDQFVVVTLNVGTADSRTDAFVTFPDLKQVEEGKPTIDLGGCYMPIPSSARDTAVPEGRPPTDVTTPLQDGSSLRITNITSQPILLSAIPNLKGQCKLFIDAAETREAVAVPVGPHCTVSLRISLRPILPQDAYTRGDCRQLVGGIRIIGQSADAAQEGKVPASDRDEKDHGSTAGAKLFESTIKFVGTAGFSILQLVPASIGLTSANLRPRGTNGSPHGPAVVKSSFNLVNLTKALPLRYRFLSQECA